MNDLIRYKEKPKFEVDGTPYEIWVYRERRDDASIYTGYRLRTPKRYWWQFKKRMQWVREWTYGCQRGECYLGDIVEMNTVNDVLRHADYLSKRIE